MNFELRQTPFSRFGSYFPIMVPPAAPPQGEGLYLRCHRAGGIGARDVFRIDLLRDGHACPATAVGAPNKLLLRAEVGAGTVDICFEDAQTLRPRGHGGAGLRLRLQEGVVAVAYPLDGGRWVVNARHRLHLDRRSAADAPPPRTLLST